MPASDCARPALTFPRPNGFYCQLFHGSVLVARVVLTPLSNQIPIRVDPLAWAWNPWAVWSELTTTLDWDQPIAGYVPPQTHCLQYPNPDAHYYDRVEDRLDAMGHGWRPLSVT
jgi:hypothetical protein